MSSMTNESNKKKAPAHDQPQTNGDAADAPTHDLETTLARQLDELEELVREHPLATVGIAAGLGLLAGLLLRRQ